MVVAGVITLDATVGRWLLSYASTFRTTFMQGGAPDSGRLLVYLPGMLFDGDDSVAEVKDALLANVANGLFVSYGFKRFMAQRVIKRTAAAIGYSGGEFDRLVIVGASFGGRLAAEVSAELRTRYLWDSDHIEIIMVDTPCENNSFQEPGLRTSLILKRLYFGPLVSLLLQPVIRLVLVPPYKDEVQEGLDYNEVKKKAVSRMAKFWMSFTADQQRYLADNSIAWTTSLRNMKVTYLMCAWRNITVEQPAAMNRIAFYTENSNVLFSREFVDSPHCGFLQLPDLWSGVFRKVISMGTSESDNEQAVNHN